MTFLEPDVNATDNVSSTRQRAEEEISTAERAFSRTLATPGVDDATRRQAQVGLERVAAARNQLTETGEQRLSAGSQLLFSTLATFNQGVGIVSSAADEFIDIFRDGESFELGEIYDFEGTTGISGDGRSFLEKLFISAQVLNPTPITFSGGRPDLLIRDIGLQGSFSEILNEIEIDSTGGAIARSLFGFGLDVALDPLTYLGGAGLLANTAEGAATQGFRRLAGTVYTREAASRFFADEARGLATGAVAGSQNARLAEQFYEIARQVSALGPENAFRSFDEELATLFSRYSANGLSFRIPFSRTISRFTGGDIPRAVAIPGTDVAVVRNIRAVGERIGAPLQQITPAQRATRAAARNGDQRGFDNFQTMAGIVRRAGIEGSRFLRDSLDFVTDLVPGIDLNQFNNITRQSIPELQRYRQPGVVEAYREAIEGNAAEGIAPRTTGTINVNGEEFELEWFTTALSDIRDRLNMIPGINIGEVENYFPRIFQQIDDAADDRRIFNELTSDGQQQRFIQQRNLGAGSFVGFDENGAAVILRDGSIAEVRAAYALTGRESTRELSQDLIGTLYGYLEGAAQLVSRAQVDFELSLRGIKSSPDHFNGKALIRMLQNTVELRTFDDPQAQDIIAKIIPRLEQRQAAIEYANPTSKGTLKRLADRKEAARQAALAPDEVLETLQRNIETSSEQVLINEVGTEIPTRLRASNLRALNEASMLEGLVLRSEATLARLADGRQALREVEVSARSEGRGHIIAQHLRDIDEEVASTQAVLAQATIDREAAVGVAESILRDTNNTPLRNFYESSLELERFQATDIRNLNSAERVLNTIELNIGQEIVKFGNRQGRREIIENNSLRQIFVDAVNEGRVGELSDTVRGLRDSGTLTAAEIEVIEPVIRELEGFIRLDTLSLDRIYRDPLAARDLFNQRAEDFFTQSTEVAQRRGLGRREAIELEDNLYTAGRLMDASVRIMDDAIGNHLPALNAAIEAGDATAAQLVHLRAQVEARIGYAQEAASYAELASLGQPFSADRTLDIIESMTPNQWQNIVNNMTRQSDQAGLLKINGTADLAQTPEIAQALNYRAQVMSEDSGKQILEVTRNLRRFFNPQALLSPGFSVRNMISGAHMNGVVGGLWRPADYAKGRDMLVYMRRQQLGVSPETINDGLGLTQREIEVAQTLWRNFDDQQSRLGDRLDTILENQTPRLNQREQGTLPSSLREARDQLNDRAFVSIQTIGEISDRTVAGFITNRGRIRRASPSTRGESLEAVAEDYGVEEFLRFTLGSHVMLNQGLGVDAAVDIITKTHFDYADLNLWDRRIRDTTFPFWTFMSRNLPLQIELLAKRPGQYNNLIAWQEALYERNDDGGLTPDFATGRLHFTVPEEVWMLGGDLFSPKLLFDESTENVQFAPDLAFNDLLTRVNDFGDVFSLNFSDETIGNIGGPDPQAGLNMILGDSAPWVKVWFELFTGEDSFSGRDFRQFEDPITESFPLERFNGITEVTGALFSTIGWASRQPVNPNEPDGERRWQFDGQANQVLRQFLPLLGRMEQLNPTADSRLDARQKAAWLSFLVGGVRSTGPTDDLIASFQLSEEAEAIVNELENYAVPQYDDIRGRVFDPTIDTLR